LAKLDEIGLVRKPQMSAFTWIKFHAI